MHKCQLQAPFKYHILTCLPLNTITFQRKELIVIRKLIDRSLRKLLVLYEVINKQTTSLVNHRSDKILKNDFLLHFVD